MHIRIPFIRNICNRNDNVPRSSLPYMANTIGHHFKYDHADVKVYHHYDRKRLVSSGPLENNKERERLSFCAVIKMDAP